MYHYHDQQPHPQTSPACTPSTYIPLLLQRTTYLLCDPSPRSRHLVQLRQNRPRLWHRHLTLLEQLLEDITRDSFPSSSPQETKIPCLRTRGGGCSPISQTADRSCATPLPTCSTYLSCHPQIPQVSLTSLIADPSKDYPVIVVNSPASNPALAHRPPLHGGTSGESTSTLPQDPSLEPDPIPPKTQSRTAASPRPTTWETPRTPATTITSGHKTSMKPNSDPTGTRRKPKYRRPSPTQIRARRQLTHVHLT